MRTLVIEIEAARHSIPLDEDENEIIDPDSLYDYWIHEVISDPEYTWKVVEEDGTDVTSEYRYPSEQ